MEIVDGLLESVPPSASTYVLRLLVHAVDPEEVGVGRGDRVWGLGVCVCLCGCVVVVVVVVWAEGVGKWTRVVGGNKPGSHWQGH